mgnify:CR=1 FL=1
MTLASLCFCFLFSVLMFRINWFGKLFHKNSQKLISLKNENDEYFQTFHYFFQKQEKEEPETKTQPNRISWELVLLTWWCSLHGKSNTFHSHSVPRILSDKRNEFQMLQILQFHLIQSCWTFIIDWLHLKQCIYRIVVVVVSTSARVEFQILYLWKFICTYVIMVASHGLTLPHRLFLFFHWRWWHVEL